ncbi:hypothetical protein GRI35_13360 [Altererythrobacter aestiaquae]|uniref:Uncharacterized protein n=1 Tax=Pontixanthobacter aestiaquae TaxID=1509367 RepID=A0A844Z969_9SPHN|nr:hypothetical protein [Pontixanthobacter aestiaquae]
MNDSVAGECFGLAFVNLTANDSDPEPNYPLNLLAISAGSGGQASAAIVTSSVVEVYFGGQYDITTFTYTVEDSLGATDTATLTVASACQGGGGLPQQ